jgi:hypothetical protein
LNGRSAEAVRRKARALRAFSALDDNDVVVVCAWCECVWLDGTWFEQGVALMAALASRKARKRISHGICATCRNGLT